VANSILVEVELPIAILPIYKGLEFATEVVREWLQHVRAQTLFITSGSPWENGYIESFNGRLRNKLLDRELLDAPRGV